MVGESALPEPAWAGNSPRSVLAGRRLRRQSTATSLLPLALSGAPLSGFRGSVRPLATVEIKGHVTLGCCLIPSPLQAASRAETALGLRRATAHERVHSHRICANTLTYRGRRKRPAALRVVVIVLLLLLLPCLPLLPPLPRKQYCGTSAMAGYRI